MRTVLACSACIVFLLASVAAGATTTSISQFGITWTFDQPVEYGQFANGDYWVVGPVNITSFSPASVDAGGYIINGSMINPVPETSSQGFDSRITNVTYDAGLNVAYGVSAASPLVAPAHSSIISTISLGSQSGAYTLDTAAILTVLPAAAPAGSFRPAYCPTDKSIDFNISDLNYSRLLSLAPQGSPPSLSEAERLVERPWIEFVPNWPSRYIHPMQNMPDYGEYMARDVNQAALSLHLDYSNAEKETLLIRFVQLGLDLYGVVEAGGTNLWPGAGGQSNGRKWPILFAGLMLDDTNIQHVQALFSEDDQTYYGVGWTGQTALWRGYEGMPYLQEEKHPSLWTVDGRGEPGDPPAGSNSDYRMETYRHCCTSHIWVGVALSAYLMDAEGLWGHSAFFGYVDRWMTEDWNPYLAIVMAETGRTMTNYQGGTSPGWAKDMWIAYRSLGGPVPPTADAGDDQTVRDNDNDGSEDAALDGSVSVALGSIVSYAWSEAAAPIATGVSPTVALAVGVHTIDLMVTDDNGTSHSDSVVVTVDPAPAGGGTVLFDLTGSLNYDAVSTQSEADNRTSGTNIWESYGDHQPWANNRNFVMAESGRDGMPDHGWVVTTYGDYRVSTDYAEATPTPGSNSPNSIYLYRPAGGATPGTETLDVDLAPADQGHYATVNVLGVGTSTDASDEQARFTLEARYADATREAIYVSGLNGAGNQVGLPQPLAASVTGLAPQSAHVMSHWCENNTGGQVLFSVVPNSDTVNLWELGGDDGLPVAPDKVLVGFSLTFERVGPYPFSSKVVLFAISGKPPQVAPKPGDADGDGDVDLDDFVILKQNFGRDDAARTDGDFDGDEDVDLDDFVILKQNFGT